MIFNKSITASIPLAVDMLNNTSPTIIDWSGLRGSATGLAITEIAAAVDHLLIIISADTQSAQLMFDELVFYSSDELRQQIYVFPGWETLPYDQFSPHPDIISQRLALLYKLQHMEKGIVIVPANAMMQRLCPVDYINGRCLSFKKGAIIDREKFRQQLVHIGYLAVSQVSMHGEFAFRGGIIDIFPMGGDEPLRLDLFGDEIEQIKTFDVQTQRSQNVVDDFEILPAREFPLHEESYKAFRERFRNKFAGNLHDSAIYAAISAGNCPRGIEYYLPLFFEHTAHFFDYCPALFTVIKDCATEHVIDEHARTIEQRYNELSTAQDSFLLSPQELYLSAQEFATIQQRFKHIINVNLTAADNGTVINFPNQMPPILTLALHSAKPVEILQRFLAQNKKRVLFVVESQGRIAIMREILKLCDIAPDLITGWHAFNKDTSPYMICSVALHHGLVLDKQKIIVITERQLFGDIAKQQRKKSVRIDPKTVIANLVELHQDDPVVHIDHGVGRYRGLQKLEIKRYESEFVVIEYADGDKLYIPVTSLHLISRYSGSDPDTAPLHKLGSEIWQRVRKKAIKRSYDVAAELLELYAQRRTQIGHRYTLPDDAYATFVAAFPFVETEDQKNAIDEIINDMCSDKIMDRLICGDVGFGKTEVAMRAAFIAVTGGKQVAVLVPTTLLAQQHYQTFLDRFSGMAVNICVLSRFLGQKEQRQIKAEIANGKQDIIIGTHKLLQKDMSFDALGLIIIDEEHRFGVRHKEKIKALCSNTDVVTLTATPIPRTLNLALSELRDISLITTPPVDRLAINTIQKEWDENLIRDYCLREMMRGGQVYFLHNEVESIDKMVDKLAAIMPSAIIKVAHGQMREKELEQVMLDFYHHRVNILVCTTIIESGIDVPSANTIIINRADKLGLAQLYQLRGRVGRSHHHAFAYLITPPRHVISKNAQKRLDAIESLTELGMGFTLATHDMEIRGAGELLGDEQSGHIRDVGFSMYMDLLERAVKTLRSGKTLDMKQAVLPQTEVNLGVATLIPDNYIQDIHLRLVFYKRIASTSTAAELDNIRQELVDRFGLLPEETKNLFTAAEIRLRLHKMAIEKLDITASYVTLHFGNEPDIDTAALITLITDNAEQFSMLGDKKLRCHYDTDNMTDDMEQTLAFIDDLLDVLSGDKIKS